MPTKEKTANIYNLEGKPVGTITLPQVFATPLRPDVIKRAVLSIQSRRLQPQGRDPMAGKRTSAESRGTGMAIARVPRIKGGSGRAAFAPSTVGGRQPQPPVSAKRIVKAIPSKEARLGLFSAVAATAARDVVVSRGHAVEGVPEFPLVVDDAFCALGKARDVEAVLGRLGVLGDVSRVRASRKIRAGKGKRRGRKMKQAVGPLFVVAENCSLVEAAGNLPGVGVVKVGDLNAELLAPGACAGRLTVWTRGAVERLRELCSVGVVA
ncbi:MAG: 50S ribosomal protein L4 [Candidatus Bathyarchaeota archaeon]|nr:50S ribosomal protein L4 [Candidatus Bathyarchaeota archaeon]